jgi:gamma-glutamylcyclotransferase (GGCT)/AIG2-like uncharacterized protein YtfP
MTSLFFAYGTLMPPDQEAADRDGWTPDAVRGRLYDLGSYPAVVDLDRADAGWVEGYVRRVEPSDLTSYDAWEDVELGPYRRVETTTRTNRRVWIYVYGWPLPPQARGPLSRWQAPARQVRV